MNEMYTNGEKMKQINGPTSMNTYTQDFKNVDTRLRRGRMKEVWKEDNEINSKLIINNILIKNNI